MFYFNRVILAGTVSAPVEVRYTTNGEVVLWFTLKVRSGIKHRKQEMEQEPEIEVIAFGVENEKVAKAIMKGHNVFVEGSLEERVIKMELGVKKALTVVAQKIALLKGGEA
ncbi:MAG: single-stranded DNA-binding protein [Candidatus Bathyarchaeia archaeon]